MVKELINANAGRLGLVPSQGMVKELINPDASRLGLVTSQGKVKELINPDASRLGLIICLKIFGFGGCSPDIYPSIPLNITIGYGGYKTKS
jgi:hypothetical protein